MLITEHLLNWPETAVVGAELCFDRFAIERQAAELIDKRLLRRSAAIPHQEYRDNARTALMEALTASGHLSRVEISGQLADINNQIMSRLLNGWSDQLPPHEQRRRFHEICEELTIQQAHQAIVEGRLPADTLVAVVSDYPSDLSDELALSLGYRAYNQKGMLRTTQLLFNTDGSCTRLIEQISRANGTAQTTKPWLATAGIFLDETQPADLAALARPLLFRQAEYVDGVVDLQRQLDAWAGPDIRYGESLISKPQLPYELLRSESAWREAQIGHYIDNLADLEAQLAASGVNTAEASTIYLEEVDRSLAAICTIHPDYAEDTFGHEAAGYFYQAAELYALGLQAQAEALLTQTQNLRQTVTFCGQAISIEQAKELGLKVNEYGELLEPTDDKAEMPAMIRCINCSQKVPSRQVVKATTWCCPKCKYEVDICTGAVLCKGRSIKKEDLNLHPISPGWMVSAAG